MATLFNTKISATYPGLIKTIDNAVLAASLKELTDGSGNQTGVYLNTAGDLKVTNVLEWGSLKDTGENITITKLVDQADGIANNNNDTSLPTSKAVKDYVDTKFSQTDTLQEVLTFGNTTSGTDIAVSANDDITFTDTSKILMGASSDLQIYHDGSNSFIKDTGTGQLKVSGSQVLFYNAAVNGFMVKMVEGAEVELYYNSSKKLATTNTGVDVTGNLVVSGTITGSGGSFLPLAGGTMTGNIVLNDSVKSIYGTSSDGLEIYHDGSNSLIADTGTGLLNIRSNEVRVTNAAGNEIQLQAIENSSVKLYFDGGERFYTSSAGAVVTGDLTVTGSITGSGGSFLPLAGGTMTGNTIHNDNVKSIYGTASDGLEIYHDGSDSYINDTGTGSLIIRSADNIKLETNAAELYFQGIKDGAVKLYYDNAERLITSSTGVTITGDLLINTDNGGYFQVDVSDNSVKYADNVKAKFGTGHDLEIYHDGSISKIIELTSELQISSAGSNLYIQSITGENAIKLIPNGSVEIYYDNSKKLETTNTGISVTGNVVPTGNVAIPDAGQLKLGTNDDMLIFHDGSDGYIRNVNGQLNIQQSAVTQSIVFKTSDANSGDTTALTISRNADASFGRDVTIAGDLTVNGTTTTINTQTLAVEDPLIELAKDNSANSVDIGFYGKYNDGTARYTGLFMDASSGTELYRLFKGTTAQPTTTVDIGSTGYVAASLVVDSLNSNNIYNGEYIYHSNDTDTYFQFPAANEFKLVAGGNNIIAGDVNAAYLYYQGAVKLQTTNTGVGITGNADVSSNVLVGGADSSFAENNLRFKSAGAAYIDHNTVGQSINFRTSVSSSLDTTPLVISGANATFAGYVKAPYFTSDGGRSFKMDSVAFVSGYSNGSDANGANDLGSATNQWRDLYLSNNIIADGDFTLDSAGAIILDADSGGIQLKDGGVKYATFGKNSDDFHITANRLDGDIKFFGNDGGSSVTALTLDMSNGGNATFAGSVIAGGGTPQGASGSILKLSTSSGNTRVSVTSEATSILDFGNQADFDNGGILYDNVNKDMTFKTSANERMRITSSGNVGLGTSSPTRKLSVSSNSIVSSEFKGANTGHIIDIINTNASPTYNGIRFQHNNTFKMGVTHIADSTTKGYIQIGNGYAAGDEILVVDGRTSRVGIGESSPDTALDIVGGNADSVVNTLTLKNDNTGNSAGAGINFVVDGANDVVTSAIYGQRTASAYHQGSLQFLTKDASGGGLLERMRINSSGNVTIKAPTASGGGVLNLENTTNAVNGTDWGSLNFISNDTSTSASGIRASVVGTSTSFNGDGNLVFSTAPSNGTNTERMRISSSGNVGIANSSPSSKIHIGSNSTSGAVDIGLQNSSRHYTIKTDGGNFKVRDESAASDRIVLGTSGDTIFNARIRVGPNVGGNSTAGGNLIIDSSNSFKQLSFTSDVSGESEGVSGLVFIDDTGNSQNDLYIGGGLDENNAMNKIIFKTAANNTTRNGTERARINSYGSLVKSFSGVTKGANTQYSTSSTSTYTDILTFDTITNNRSYSLLVSSSENNFCQMYRVSGSVAQNTCLKFELGDAGHAHSKDVEFRITDISGVRTLQVKAISHTTQKVINVYDVCVALGDVTFA
jgi:hypothetical protein